MGIIGSFIRIGGGHRKKATALSQLEPHLWESANILRGPVDAADFKTYIFPLLFFKRISDACDEEFEQALEESGGDRDYAAFPENHRFKSPEGCRWLDVGERTTNMGQAIQHAAGDREANLVDRLAFPGVEDAHHQSAVRGCTPPRRLLKDLNQPATAGGGGRTPSRGRS